MSLSTPSRSTNGSTHTFAGLPEVSAQQVQDFLSKPKRLLIDGEWVEAASGKTFETFNPATEKSLGSVAYGATEDVGREHEPEGERDRNDERRLHPWRGVRVDSKNRHHQQRHRNQAEEQDGQR